MSKVTFLSDSFPYRQDLEYYLNELQRQGEVEVLKIMYDNRQRREERELMVFVKFTVREKPEKGTPFLKSEFYKAGVEVLQKPGLGDAHPFAPVKKEEHSS